MLYMVVYRTPNIREWRNYGVTNTKEAASRWCADLMRASSDMEVRVLSAADEEALQALFAKQNNPGALKEMPGIAKETTWGKAPTSFMRWGGESWPEFDRLPAETEGTRREQMEEGPGGDHDQPYHYKEPTERVKAKWSRILARVQRGEVGGAEDGEEEQKDDKRAS